jgi:nucleotide-binding universal stress UspA family protein
MRLLLAVDNSEYSQEAVRQVSTHFNPKATEIKMLHVLTPASYSTPPQMSRGYAPEMEELEKEARSYVEDVAKELRIAGFAVDSAVETGEVRSTIIDSAADWGADLIVVGSRGHKGLERLLLGSVAESVVRHAKSSVLVVRKPALKTKSG